MGLPEYRISRGPLPAGIADPAWQGMECMAITQFRPESCQRAVQAGLRLCHDGYVIAGRFEVREPSLLARYRGFQQPVYRDSCVECFVQPRGRGGYFNFEFNALGAMLVYWIEDPVREGHGFRRYRVLSGDDCRQVQVVSTVPATVDPEQAGPWEWLLAFRVPVALLEAYAGTLGDLSGQHWRGNAYKCADDSANPHWAAWATVDALDFHRPQCFGEWVFG